MLNSINKGSNEGSVRFCVPDPPKPSKPKERITTAQEKIFIMVPDTICEINNLIGQKAIIKQADMASIAPLE